VYIAGGFYCVDLLARIFWENTVFPRKTTLLKQKCVGLTQIRFKKQLMWLHPKRYHVGQYIFVNFPLISAAEWHPFSVSSDPAEHEIEIHVRALGNWTKKLAQYAESEDETWIKVDGPYGNLNLNYHRYTNLLLVAGGIGITPILGLLKDLFCSSKSKPSRINNVTVVWSVPTAAESQWFSTELAKFVNNSTRTSFFSIATKIPYTLDLRVHITRPNKDAQPPQSPFQYYHGRPDMEAIFDVCAKNTPCFVFVCGPRKLVSSCWDITNRHMLQGHFFHFHHETFEF